MDEKWPSHITLVETAKEKPGLTMPRSLAKTPVGEE